jgi:hypothetical protein
MKITSLIILFFIIINFSLQYNEFSKKKLIVKESKIRGRGVFADEDIEVTLLTYKTLLNIGRRGNDESPKREDIWT